MLRCHVVCVVYCDRSKHGVETEVACGIDGLAQMALLGSACNINFKG